MLRQNDFERLLLSYLYKKDYEDIDPDKEERISLKAMLEFMKTHQKTKLTIDDFMKYIKYFDSTADDESLSVRGGISTE